MRHTYHDSRWIDSAALSEARDIEAGLLEVLGESEEATPDDIDRWVGDAVSQLTPAESESVGKGLRQIGQWARKQSAIRQLAGKALPTTGTILGTAYGGAAGAAIGGSLGKVAGKAVAGAKPIAKPAPSPSTQAPGAVSPAATVGGSPAAAHPSPSMQAPAAVPGAATVSGSPAAAQLLYLIGSGPFRTSLVALAMGSHGRASIPIGENGTEVPLGAFLNLLSSLVNRAAQEADVLVVESDQSTNSYLQDSEGHFLCDPAVPAQRADVLLRLLEKEEESFPIDEEGAEPDLDEYAVESWDEAFEEAFEDDWESGW